MGFISTHIFAILSAAAIAAALIAAFVGLPYVRRLLPGLMQYRHLLAAMVSRDIKIKYRRSVLGIAWSVLNPLLMMVIITIVFSQIFRITTEYFPVYYLMGWLIFNFITESTNASMNSIISNVGLIKKTYIPKYLFPLQKVLFSLVNIAFSFIAVVIVYIALQAPLSPTALLLVIPIIYAAVFALGLSLILSAAVVFFRDIAHLYSVITLAWMYLSALFYPADILPPSAQILLAFNPAFHYISYARDVTLNSTIPGLTENLYCIAFALITLGVGMLIFKKTQDQFILRI